VLVALADAVDLEFRDYSFGTAIPVYAVAIVAFLRGLDNSIAALLVRHARVFEALLSAGAFAATASALVRPAFFAIAIVKDALVHFARFSAPALATTPSTPVVSAVLSVAWNSAIGRATALVLGLFTYCVATHRADATVIRTRLARFPRIASAVRAASPAINGAFLAVLVVVAEPVAAPEFYNAGLIATISGFSVAIVAFLWKLHESVAAFRAEITVFRTRVAGFRGMALVVTAHRLQARAGR